MTAALKIELGTKVVVNERYSRKIGIITKITKTGQFETSITNDTKFNADGSQRSRDLWNKSKLCYIAFKKYPNATEIKYSVGSGCYVDIKYKDKNGQEFSGVIYNHRDDNYLDR